MKTKIRKSNLKRARKTGWRAKQQQGSGPGRKKK